MLNRSTSVRSALAFIGALLGLASWAAARRLVVRKGDHIPFRMALPPEAQVESKPGLLSGRIGELLVMAVAKDLMEDGSTAVPDRNDFSRRILTSITMGSDALLFALLDEEFRDRKLELGNAVRGIGTLGGQRSACVRGRFEERGVEGWLDVHATVKDGILYMLAFTVVRGEPGAHEPLIARIRESFALPL